MNTVTATGRSPIAAEQVVRDLLDDAERKPAHQRAAIAAEAADRDGMKP